MLGPTRQHEFSKLPATQIFSTSGRKVRGRKTEHHDHLPKQDKPFFLVSVCARAKLVVVGFKFQSNRLLILKFLFLPRDLFVAHPYKQPQFGARSQI